jgi:hypothetical protein
MRLRGLPLSILAGLFLASACGDDPPKDVLQPMDLQKPEGLEQDFDRNTLIEASVFQDSESFPVESIQRFLAKTPYDRPSFLETYQSNGVRASDAVISAARKYKLNPLVLLVYAEITQGLVGERAYPFPPERVEYVFQCGCLQTRNCLPEQAGLDRQFDCLGRAIRASLDEIKANEQTISGWGVGIERLTLDGINVSPANDATAAVYDRTPRVNEGKAGGSWVFWNVFNIYSAHITFGGPNGVTDSRWIGDACIATTMCGGFEGSICADNYPDGMCTSKCTDQCPTEEGKPETFCAKFADGTYCLPTCNPASPRCRNGYRCVTLPGATGASNTVCSPTG